MKQITLICVPFAGGSKYSLIDFCRSVSSDFDVVSIELPGRGDRLKEALIKDIHSMCDDLYHQIERYLSAPYIIYGHSMGGLLAYLITKKINKYHLPPPLELFVSGTKGPSVPRSGENEHLWPREKLIGSLINRGGLPTEIAENSELIDLYEPILRSDFQAINEYHYERTGKLSIPITAMVGTRDTTSFEEAEMWESETNANFDLFQFEGDHFFIYRHKNKILELIASKWGHRKMCY